jgi:hypothetical protein
MRPNLNIAIPLNQGGTFTFSNALTRSNLADFLLGQGVNFSQQAGQYVNLIGTAYSLFAQDNWRVTQKLTLNLGTRWDPYWPYKESHNAIACYVPGAKSQRYPNAPAGVIYGGDPGCPSGAGSYPNPANFAPRLGFAYRLGGQTVLRGGVGLYYQLPQGSTYNLVTQTAPFSPSVTLTGTCLADPYGCAGAANPFPANFGLVVPGASATFSATPSNVSQSASIRGRIPALGTWNLMLQREVAHHWLLSAAYVGTSGWRLFSTQVGHLNANPAVYVPGASTVANTQSRRLNPSVGVARVFTAHNSSYNSMQLEARKRFSRGFSLWANYTWSHTLDNFPAPRGQNTVHMDSFDRGRDWGNSLENVPNVLHVSGVWEIPAPVRGSLRLLAGGWQLAPILTWQNGLPFTVLSGVDNSRSGNGFDRAEFLGRSLREAVLGDRPHGEMAARFFDTSLFAANALGTFGNTGKNILQGPGLFQINLGLAKDVNLTENTAVQFRAEFSNALNNVNFSAPNSTVNSAAFGQITAAAGERVLQFGLKVRF